MKRFFYHGLVVLCVITLTYSACKKDNTTNDLDITSVEENAQADEDISDTFTDISSLSVENSAMFNAGTNQIQHLNTPTVSTDCATITVSPQGDVWPKTVTIDLGTGCTKENITRKGKIIAVFTNRFKTTGAKVTITFDNYYINDNKIEGTKTITNNGKNASGNYTFTVEVSRSRISSSNRTFSWTANRTIEWIKGEGTITALDDEFSITGSSTGTNSKGKDYTVTITKPLLKKVGCRFIVSGTLEIKPADRPVRVLDYGNGDCDAKATVSVNGTTKEIFLRK